MIKVDFFLSAFQEVDVNVADSMEIFGWECSPEYGDIESVKVYDDGLSCISEKRTRDKERGLLSVLG
jgi:hypothetical protein